MEKKRLERQVTLYASAALDFDVADVVDALQGVYDFRRNLLVHDVDGDGVAAVSNLP